MHGANSVQKTMKTNRKLTKSGGGRSYSIVVPHELIKDLGWRDGQKLIMKKINGAIVIRDAKTKKRK
jgi:bifunctional DNA-binding transcriptional regulator/antitoxin component of YhaV-PrlF toxin-antitoxin module